MADATTNTMEASTSVWAKVYDNTVQEPVETVPEGFYDDLLTYCQIGCITGFFILAALFLQIGVNLWQCFSDKWRN